MFLCIHRVSHNIGNTLPILSFIKVQHMLSR